MIKSKLNDTLPLVSIALCTYNGEKYLEEQLQSLTGQSYADIEIIVVDDNSADDTWSIVQAYAGKYEHIKPHRNSKNLGFTKNFEKAISLCSGEFIALCDQDDIWHKDKIRRLVEHIDTHQLIYHDSELVSDNGASMNLAISDFRNFYRGSDNRYFLLENCVSGHAVMFRKTLLLYLIPIPERMFHDWWLAFIATSYGSIDYLGERLVKYRQHELANTDILLQKSTKAPDNKIKVWKEEERMRIFASYPHVPNAQFIKRLAKFMNQKTKSLLSFNLFFFMIRYQHIVLYIRKKSLLSKLNHCLKFLWGYRIKS